MEVEAKFVADAGVLDRLAAASTLAGYQLGEARTLELTDTYLDTPDAALAAAGYACRRRLGDKGVAFQVKQLAGAAGGVHRREELEVVLEAEAAPADWPEGAARDLVLALAGETQLQTLVELRQTRLLRAVMDGDREVAELSLDTVVVAGPEGALPPYDEVEAELRPAADDGDLAALLGVLRDELGLTPESRSKLERALEAVGRPPGTLLSARQRVTLLPLAARDDRTGRRARAMLALDDGGTQLQIGTQLGVTSRTVRRWLRTYREQGLDRLLEEEAGEEPIGAEPAEAAAPRAPAAPDHHPARPGIRIDDTMATAAVKTLRFHFHRMLDHEEGTRLGDDPEELHDMRVATRRMRAALQVFAGHLDPKAVRPIAKGLRRTGRTLGAVRDLDVFYGKTQGYLETLPEECRYGLDPLLAAWRAEREAARARLLEYLDSDQYRRFVARFQEFLEKPEAAELPALAADGSVVPHRVADVLPAVIYQRMAAVWAYAGPLAAPDPPLVRFHRLRIAGKFLRYTLEFFEEVLGPEGRPLIRSTKDLQDHLGDLQDAVVTCGVLRTFLTWGAWNPPRRASHEPPGVVAPGVAAYLARRQRELQELVDTFPSTWAKVNGPQFGRELATVAVDCRWQDSREA
jgi:CHAD domain-containing protein/transposase-like protein